MRLLRMREAGRRARGVAQDLEHRKRPAQQRIEAGARLHHDELPGRRRRGNRRRGQRQHVVVARQRPVRDHLRRHIDRHRGSILQRNSHTGSCRRTSACCATRCWPARAWHGVRDRARPASEPASAAEPRAAAAARHDRRPLLRRPPHGDLLHPARAPAAPRAGDLFAGLDQRRRAGVARARWCPPPARR